MRKASALSRFVAFGIAAGVLLSGCGQPPAPPAADTVHAPAADTVHAPAADTVHAPAADTVHAPAAGRPAAPGVDPVSLPYGSVYRNPANGRDEMVVRDISNTALLIGDSQSEPADGWPRRGLAAAGYGVYFCGLGGTGFVAANGRTGNYIDALERGDWKLPYGTPRLIVIQGGGNDAARGATDAQIVANADRLIAALSERYPGTQMAMIGTLGRGANYGGGRRSQVDSLLGTVAAKHGMPFVAVGDWLTKYGLAKDLADAVHMNPSGRASLGKLLEGRLRELRLDAKPHAMPGSLAVTGADPEWTE